MELNPSKDIVLCHEQDAPYMTEFLRSITQRIAPLKLYSSYQAPFTDPSLRYICVRRIPWWLIPQGSNVVFINTEQLTVPQKLAEYKTFVEDKSGWGVTDVYDYSRENIRIANRGKYLPVSENNVETRVLKQFLREAADHYDFDIAVVGTETMYRNDIVQKLRDAGFTVDYITNAWGAERDRRVAKCKILVNLHAYPDYRLYEPIRCERWRHAGMPIASEPCQDAVPSDIVVFDPRDMPTSTRILQQLLQTR